MWVNSVSMSSHYVPRPCDLFVTLRHAHIALKMALLLDPRLASTQRLRSTHVIKEDLSRLEQQCSAIPTIAKLSISSLKRDLLFSPHAVHQAQTHAAAYSPRASLQPLP
jgi:hypothetical protein